jgi:tyrosyl-tRNA synthetase
MEKLNFESDISLVNNIDWINDLKLIDFLTSIGKHIRINTMLSRDRLQINLKII